MLFYLVYKANITPNSTTKDVNYFPKVGCKTTFSHDNTINLQMNECIKYD